MRHENGVLSIITQLKLLKANKLPFQQESSIHSLTQGIFQLVIKGYLRYKTIFCSKVAPDVYLMIYFI